MRFITRSLTGLFLLSLTLGLLILAGSQIFRALEQRAAGDQGRMQPQEREFAVNVETLEPTTAIPVITAYGEVESWRTLELRAAVQGPLVELATEFRDGGEVEGGSVLARIDPADAESEHLLAEAGVSEAEVELAESKDALELAKAELDAAVQQRNLRDQALTRQKDLLDRGAGTTAAVEDAELTLATTAQVLVGRRQALAQATTRIDRAEIALTRSKITLAEAQRALEDTELSAPFDGVLSEVTAVRGRLVSANEKLGVLIDPQALEVAFRVTSAQYARLIDEHGRLKSLPITAKLSLDGIPIEVSGSIDRSGAEVGEGQTGRLLYARLEGTGVNALRPGDFMEVTIEEPPLDNVAVIPATAATNDGRILLIADGDRLEETSVTILRRQGDILIVADAPFGREFPIERLPQIGEGVKVRPIRPGEQSVEPEMVRLDPERRERLIAAVEANTFMPEDVRQRIVARLQEEEVPAETVARIEERMSSNETASEETVELDEDRRARLIAFVEGNERMPSEAKTRILAQLKEAQVPKSMVEQLESRMGG
jgi:multidrug efflux pump subunit AcrA (membrane-fusion protein)